VRDNPQSKFQLLPAAGGTPITKLFCLKPTMEWQTVSVELKELKEYRVGQATGRKISKEKLSDIIRLGIMTKRQKRRPFPSRDRLHRISVKTHFVEISNVSYPTK
jgi:hypothetical protein